MFWLVAGGLYATCVFLSFAACFVGARADEKQPRRPKLVLIDCAALRRQEAGGKAGRLPSRAGG